MLSLTSYICHDSARSTQRGPSRTFIPASFVWVGIAILLLFHSASWAQSTTADMVGRAIDTTGAVLPGVSISVQNLNTGAKYSGTTDGEGNYSFTLLPIGPYTMRAEASGFKTWIVGQVTLAIGDRLSYDPIPMALLRQVNSNTFVHWIAVSCGMSNITRPPGSIGWDPYHLGETPPLPPR